MRLHQRDYTKLNGKEKSEWLNIQQRERRDRDSLPRLKVAWSIHDYSKAIRHFWHLFPNNYLDTAELKKTRMLERKVERFRSLLASPRLTERRILRLIREERAHFIVGSILKNFDFGHHEAYLFPEFPLGTSHKPDYLLVGKSSGGYEFVFVELEAPAKNITIRGGDFGKAFRNGRSQVADWDRWLNAHYQTLSEIFCRFKRSDMNLPAEFTHFDQSRVHFVVVAGRRGDFKEKTYRMRRSGRQKGGPLVLHYDNLLDSAEGIIGKRTY